MKYLKNKTNGRLDKNVLPKNVSILILIIIHTLPCAKGVPLLEET